MSFCIIFRKVPDDMKMVIGILSGLRQSTIE